MPTTGEPVLDGDGKGLSDSGLVPNTDYTYTMTAEDEAGNVSAAGGHHRAHVDRLTGPLPALGEKWLGR